MTISKLISACLALVAAHIAAYAQQTGSDQLKDLMAKAEKGDAASQLTL